MKPIAFFSAIGIGSAALWLARGPACDHDIDANTVARGCKHCRFGPSAGGPVTLIMWPAESRYPAFARCSLAADAIQRLFGREYITGRRYRASSKCDLLLLSTKTIMMQEHRSPKRPDSQSHIKDRCTSNPKPGIGCVGQAKNQRLPSPDNTVK